MRKFRWPSEVRAARYTAYMKFSLSAALALALAGLIAGCGQKGALVLPDQAKHRKIPQVPRPQQSPASTAPPAAAGASSQPSH